MREIPGRACDQNGMLDGGKYKDSTRRELADWLNKIARKVGVDRTERNPEGYFATEENIG